MTEAFQPNLDFTAAEQVDAREAFVVDLDGYEGPLHVLLALARTQKVDLLKLSITRLAEQYLAFVHEARRRNFSLAADYLVMASWLAYLKSRLLLPRTEKGKGGEMPAEEMAAALKFAGYDHDFVFGEGAHNGNHGGAIFPDSMRWLWRK